MALSRNYFAKTAPYTFYRVHCSVLFPTHDIKCLKITKSFVQTDIVKNTGNKKDVLLSHLNFSQVWSVSKSFPTRATCIPMTFPKASLKRQLIFKCGLGIKLLKGEHLNSHEQNIFITWILFWCKILKELCQKSL